MPAKQPAGMLRCGGQHLRSTTHCQRFPLCSNSTMQGWEGYTSGQALLPKSMGCALPSPCGWEFGCPWHRPAMVWPGEPCPQLHRLHRHCLGDLGRSNTGTYIKLGKISAVKLLGLGIVNGKEMGQPGPEEGPAAFSKGRVCLGFYTSLNGPLEKFITTLSDLHKRHNQGNSPLTRSQYNQVGSRVPAS